MKRELRLLLVDDQDSYSDFLKSASDIWGDKINVVLDHVHSSTEAIGRLEELKPNVIMVDAHLPDVNTLNFVKQCSARGSTLVVTSEQHSHQLESSAINFGASAYFPKTIDPDEIEGLFEQLAAISGNYLELH